jgi:uncharacterized protein YndB with AHSA1/START domain
MTIVDTTPPAQSLAISFDIDLPHSKEKVWRALTDPVLLTEWLLPVVGFKLEAGASFTFKAPPQPGWDGMVNSQVLEIEPHLRLSYRWVVGQLDTIVTFTLTPTTLGTRLSIVQSGFANDQKQNWGGARYGWKMMGGRLVDVLSKY